MNLLRLFWMDIAFLVGAMAQGYVARMTGNVFSAIGASCCAIGSILLTTVIIRRLPKWPS